MIAVGELPSLEELSELIGTVPSYPISAAHLTSLAATEGAQQRVIDFYRSFPHDQIFVDKDDLANRTEQVQIMRTEEEEQPIEELRSPEE